MPSSAAPRCAGLLFIALALAGCGGSSSSSGTLRVTVVKNPTAQPAAAVSVRLLGLTLTALTTASGVATFSDLAPGSYTVRIGLIGYCQDERDAEVIAGEITELFVWLCTDSVAPNGLSPNPLIAVLDLRRETPTGTECKDDLLVWGDQGRASVGDNALALAGCPGRAWILTEDQAPKFSDIATDFPWTDGQGDTYAPVLPARRLRVPVTVWMSDPGMSGPARIELANKIRGLVLPRANDIFFDNKTGLRLVQSEADDALPDIIDVASIIDPETGSAPYPKIGDNCDYVPSIQATPVVYHPDHFNVYFRSEVVGGAKGYNCLAQGAPNIVFMDADGLDYFTLPHELGHGLGLSRPSWGHTDALPGFYANGSGSLNVLGEYASAPTYFSVGQAIRMHLEPDSWLNAEVGGSSIRSRQSGTAITPLVTPCGCPHTVATDACPKLTADVPRIGTTPASVSARACYVKPAVPCVSVDPGAAVTVEALFFTSSAFGAPIGYGEAIVASLDPGVAAAMLESSGSGEKAVARIKGIAPGRAEIRIYGGGSLATVEARVGESCP